MAAAKRYGVPTGNTATRVARTLLALHVAGAGGILAADLVARVGASRATVYRVLSVVRAAGWRIESTPEWLDGVRVARLSIADWQRLPREQGAPPQFNRSRRE
jgi:DNA-binding IclR family transcriptional regulator